MHARRLALLTLIAACKRDPTNATPTSTSTSTSTSTATPTATATSTDPAKVRALMDAARVPGLSIAIVREGKVAALSAHGLADTSRGTPAQTSTLFSTASLSKLVTATCVMQLVERGKLDLDEDVSAVVPFRVRNPRFSSARITPRMLLSHASSIADDPQEMRACTTRGDPTVPLGDFLRRYLSPADAGTCFLGALPGTAVRYSNVGFALAALLVEARSGEPFASYARAHVLEPLGMNDARWRMSELDAARVAMPHRWTGAAYTPTGHVGHTVYPVVDLRATAEEMATLLAAFSQGGALGAARILRRESVDEMLRAHFPALDENQGLAFQRIRVGDSVLWGHEGEDEGATTMGFFDPKDKRGAVLLANGDAFSSGDAARAKAMKDLLQAALGVDGLAR